MSALPIELRRNLEIACAEGHAESERACRVALNAIGVTQDRPPAHLDKEQRALRRGLRAKARQLGDADGTINLLVGECAFEQWHRLLFARFLSENNLLIHPEFKAPVTLTECDELAEDFGEPDGWGVAARFAGDILPGIFRLDDPCVQLRLAPEGRLKLEQILEGLPEEVFTAQDSLGWAYQFWQRDKKNEVNASERKIGGPDLGPVTQLFTEPYMVRFLLENSLGAWWASRHPESPLLKEWEYLRWTDEGKPAAGSFEKWPDRVAEVTVMDPCCGSGHFLVEAFSMLWKMRVEEESLSPIGAQDAVLRENLFGLELDSRCVQIAMFAVALNAWKAGKGWRELPVPNIASSGIPVKAPVDEWKGIANGDSILENALLRLHILFRDADTFGSLINPKQAVEIRDSAGLQSSFEDVDWDIIAPLLAEALTKEEDDPATGVLGADAVGLARAADYLSRQYTLVITNVPYLGRRYMSESLLAYCDRRHPKASSDMATTFVERIGDFIRESGSYSLVLPQNWLFLSSYRAFRKEMLQRNEWLLCARLGPGAFEEITGEVVQATLVVLSRRPAKSEHLVQMIDVLADQPARKKGELLRKKPLNPIPQSTHLANPDSVVTFSILGTEPLLSEWAVSIQGFITGDNDRFRRYFWELETLEQEGWNRVQTPVRSTQPYGGRSEYMLWCDGNGELAKSENARVQGLNALGKLGVALGQIGDLPATLFGGDFFAGSVGVVIPKRVQDLPAIWAFCQSPEYSKAVRQLDTKLNVTNATMVKVPFDFERWQRIAEELYPTGLPEPYSPDPTQWLFEGRPEESTEPLQVAVGRLLGYRWPEQSESDNLDGLADEDGIVCLPSVMGERPAADRLQELLARSFGVTWSPSRTGEMLLASGSQHTDLESWLRQDFFKAHCKLFNNRPFVWHIWDGRKDGFAALVNYHRLSRTTLERLTFTCLGDWVERQIAAINDDIPGAEERLAAAQHLQRQLRLILDGEPPYDVYVRWKSLAKQSIGWEPDLQDGVRLNVRPFVEARVLRAKFTVKWGKDRGREADGSERHNDLHYTRAEKEIAREGSRA